jgi:formylglycine-generating enzyme required for sulfatase activity
MLVGITAYLVTPLIQEALAKKEARGELVLIPEGLTKFGINNDDSIAGTAVPLQEIPLPAFNIGKYEVTNGQYKLCVTYGKCTVPLEQADFQDSKKQNYPVAYVTLFQANYYCRWVGLRLLTEVEWERAARGPKGNSWPWGAQIPSPDFVNMPAQGTYQATEGIQAADSNSRAVSQEGVYNLVGNVSEWTSSYLYTGGKYDMTHWDGTSENFRGTAFYAPRGGGWANKIEYVSQINPISGTEVREDLGFRCGADVK